MKSKVIHQIWMDPNEKNLVSPPPKILKMMESWKSVPGYQYILWNHETMIEYIKRKDPSFLGTYLDLPMWIQRCDAFRYFVLYHYGGIYVDCDTRLIGDETDIDKILENKVTLITDHGGDLNFSNHIMSSDKGNRFMKVCYDEIEPGNNIVFTSTGPFFLHRQYKLYENKEDITIINSDLLPIQHTSEKAWVGGQVVSLGKELTVPIVLLVLLVVSVCVAFFKSGPSRRN